MNTSPLDLDKSQNIKEEDKKSSKTGLLGCSRGLSQACLDITFSLLLYDVMFAHLDQTRNFTESNASHVAEMYIR